MSRQNRYARARAGYRARQEEGSSDGGRVVRDRSWTLMEVEGYDITEGEHRMRLLPPKDQYLDKDPSPFVEAIVHYIPYRDSQGEWRKMEVLSLQTFSGQYGLDPFGLSRWRGMKMFSTREARRDWINDPKNEWMRDTRKYYGFIVVPDSNGVMREEGLRVAQFKKSIVDRVEEYATHRRRPIYIPDPFEGPMCYVTRGVEPGKDKRFGTFYKMDIEPNEGGILFPDEGRVEAFLEAIPDIKKYATMRYHMSSETDCRVFNPELIIRLMRGRVTKEEAIEEVLDKVRKGQDIISPREWEWMSAFKERLMNDNTDPFPLDRFEKSQVSVPGFGEGPIGNNSAPDVPRYGMEVTEPLREERRGRKASTSQNGGYSASPPPPAPPMDDDSDVPF